MGYLADKLFYGNLFPWHNSPRKYSNRGDFGIWRANNHSNQKLFYPDIVWTRTIAFSKLQELKIENPRKIVWAKNCLAGEIDQIVTKQFFFQKLLS